MMVSTDIETNKFTQITDGLSKVSTIMQKNLDLHQMV